MADSIRERMIQEFEYHLSGLTTANGFNTNAGADIERGRKYSDDDDSDQLNYFPGYEASERAQYAAEKITMPFKIEVLTGYSDSATSSAKGEKVLADIRESMHKILKKPEGTLASDIVYVGGGLDEHSLKSKRIIATIAEFNIIYETRIGDPYSQP